VIGNLGIGHRPTRRANLYAERLKADTAIKAWSDAADPQLDVLYAVAWRMLEGERIVAPEAFSTWVKEELAARGLPASDVQNVTDALRRSRQFRDVKTRDRLRREQDAVTFDHELVGKFLAARHLRSTLGGEGRDAALRHSAAETWQDVFLFAIDETPAMKLPALLLDSLIEKGGEIRLALVAYAIKTKSDDEPPLPAEYRERYSEVRLNEDARLAQAA